MGRHRSQPSGERWLGDSNSWRRVVSAGIVGGIALAILAALASSICSGGSGSLEDERPTVADPGPGIIPIDTEPPLPLDTVEPAATDVVVEEPTPTDVVEPSPTLPVATETEPVPTVQATATVEAPGEPTGSP